MTRLLSLSLVFLLAGAVVCDVDPREDSEVYDGHQSIHGEENEHHLLEKIKEGARFQYNRALELAKWLRGGSEEGGHEDDANDASAAPAVSKEECRRQILARARQWIGKWYGTDSPNKIVCNQLANFAYYGSKLGGGNKLARGWRQHAQSASLFPGAILAANDGSHVAVYTGTGIVNAPGTGKKVYEKDVSVASLKKYYFPSGFKVVTATDGLCNPV
jgi:hypothetical protein